MVITVFRSRLNPDQQTAYSETAARMRTLVENMPGFIRFKMFQADDGERVSIIEFESEETLTVWKEHPEHRRAQELGRTLFYSEFEITVCSVIRQNSWSRAT